MNNEYALISMGRYFHLVFDKSRKNDAMITLRKSSNISSVDVNDAPMNRESAPPKVFKKSHTVGYCSFSFTSSTSRDSKKIFTYIE